LKTKRKVNNMRFDISENDVLIVRRFNNSSCHLYTEGNSTLLRKGNGNVELHKTILKRESKILLVKESPKQVGLPLFSEKVEMVLKSDFNIGIRA
jgi:hypothetical protein